MTDLDAVALALLGAPRRKLLGALTRHFLSRPIPDVDDLPGQSPGEPFFDWACRCALGPEAARDEAARLRTEAGRAVTAGRAAGQVVVALGAPGYPPLLAQIPDPPPCLWIRGDLAAVSAARMVAVVGARAASRPGLEVAGAIAHGLAEAGIVVVSGLARGVDTAAHRAALEAGGVSVAVLGSGLDRVYPPEHVDLSGSLAERGAVVGEHPPGTPPMAYHFPLRNRIISGLCAAVVVVEASEKSGSLITAGAALEQGRDVMAVPGSVSSGRHRGAHALLKDGARLVESAADVLLELGWGSPLGPPTGPAGLDPMICAELALDPRVEDFSLDEVAASTGWPIAQVCARLGALEIAGKIQRVGCGRFMGSGKRMLR